MPEADELTPKKQRMGGPVSPQGKAISRLNATKHGLLSNVAPEHEVPAYSEHLSLVRDHYAPQGYLEELLTERVASLLWRIGRVARYESALVQQRVGAAMDRDGWGELRQAVTELWTLLQDNQDPEMTTWAEDAVQALQTAVGAASLPSEVVDKVPRYEAHLDRTLRRTLDELEQLQQTRQSSFRSLVVSTEPT